MPLFRTRFSVFTRCAALVALLAMLVPVATFLVYSPVGAQKEMRICGMQRTSHIPNPTPDHKLPSCPICQSFQILAQAFVPPEAAVLTASLQQVAVEHAKFAAFLLSLPQTPQAQPRAPPSLV